MPIIDLFAKGSDIAYDKTRVNVQVNYPNGYSGTSTFEVYVNESLYETYTTNTSGTAQLTADYGTIRIHFTNVPQGVTLPADHTLLSFGADCLTFAFSTYLASTFVNVQLNYLSGYSGASTFQVYVSGTLYNTFTTDTSGYKQITVNTYGAIQIVVTTVPVGLNIPTSQTKTSVGGDSLNFNFSTSSSYTSVSVQLNYVSGYSGASTFKVYVGGTLYNTFTTDTSGYKQITVNTYGAIQIVVTSVPSGLNTPSSQTKTSVGGDALYFTFATTRVPVTYTIPLTTSQTWSVPIGVSSIGVHLVGGGGGGGQAGMISSYCSIGGGGGGGGYTNTTTVAVAPGETLVITVGSGGSDGANGGTSQIKRNTTVLAEALGGRRGEGFYSATQMHNDISKGGNGGSGGGAGFYDFIDSKFGEFSFFVSQGVGGTNGSSGQSVSEPNGTYVLSGGIGQGTTTKDFSESSGTLRGSGGQGGGSYGQTHIALSGAANTGNGGEGGCHYGGQRHNGGAGGSGIVIVRYTV